MASVNVTNISILDNPARFTDDFKFEITFECVRELKAGKRIAYNIRRKTQTVFSDLEWKVTYVGSAESTKHDQVLDSVLVGPVPMGVNRFVFQAPPPDHTKIPKADLLGVTVALLSCLYRDKEFIRIGYYVNNEYEDPDAVIVKPGESVEAQDEMDIANSEGEEEEEEENAEEEEEGADAASGDKSTEESGPGETKEERANENVSDNADAAKDEKGEAAVKKQGGETEVTLPPNFDIKKIKRSILDDKPRVTRFAIDWDEGATEEAQEEANETAAPQETSEQAE